MRAASRREETPRHVYVVLVLGLVSFGSSAILVRFADAAPGLAVAVWRTGLAALLLLPIALPRAGAELRRLGRRDWALVLASGGVLGLHFTAYIESLYHTSIASASVLVTSSPLFIALLGYVFLRERLRPRTAVAILVGVAGAVLIGLSDAGAGVFPRAALGNSLALLAALLVSVYLLIGRAVRQRVSFLAYLLPLYVMAALTTLAVALATGVPLAQPWPIIGLCLLMALFPQLVGHGSFNYAVKYFPAALLGLLSLAEPVMASVAAYFLFGEAPGVLAVVGILLVLGSIAVVFGRRLGRR